MEYAFDTAADPGCQRILLTSRSGLLALQPHRFEVVGMRVDGT